MTEDRIHVSNDMGVRSCMTRSDAGRTCDSEAHKNNSKLRNILLWFWYAD